MKTGTGRGGIGVLPRKKASDAKSSGAMKAWATRRSAPYKARKSEQASKAALTAWCRPNRWKVLFFEGDTGAPRTGIVDALLVRIKPGDADAVEIRLVQLKAGSGGLTAREIARLRQAVASISTDSLLAAFDGQTLHFVRWLAARSCDGSRTKGSARVSFGLRRSEAS